MPAPAIGCTPLTSGPAAHIGALRGLAQTAQDLGFDSVWLPDHVVVPERIASSYPYRPDGRCPTTARQPYLEPLAALAYLAAATRQRAEVEQSLGRFAEHVRPLLQSCAVAPQETSLR